MSGTFFYLSRNSEAYSRLANEIRTTFTSGQSIQQGPQLASCKFLRAVLDETMRLSPSVLAPAWREQNPASIARGETFVVDGNAIPPGTQVAVSNYSLHRDPDLFPEPFSFRPERWIHPDQEWVVQMRRAFTPFGVGDRSCAGKPMAYLEMSLAVARTVWYFDFKRAEGEEGLLGEGNQGTYGREEGRQNRDEFQLRDAIVVEHDGPNLVFTARGEYWKDFETEQV